MAANSRFETSGTGSPDCSPFVGATSNGGHRGHGVSSSSMDRSSSFRDIHEGRSHGNGPSCDPVPLSQLLSLERVPLPDGKFSRQPEFKRATNAATGNIVEDPTLGQVQAKPLELLSAEELKKLKSCLFDVCSRAREHQKHFTEATSKLDKYRSPLKKRRTDVVEKNKGLGPSKRLRTSITDGARPNSTSTKKNSADRESPRSAPLLPSLGEEKARLPNEAWDKAKLKGRRSVKSDPPVPAVGNGVAEQEREHKWSGQHRLSQETRPRPSETHGLRSGPVHGVTSSMHKGEASAQMNGSARGILKRDVDVAAGPDRFLSTDKDRIPKNGLNPLQDDASILAMAPPVVTKGKAARTPRSSSIASTNPSHLGRVASFVDRDKPIGAPKMQPNPGQGNRKRPAPSRSSSPVQWAVQRPQKMARVARRVNLPPGGALPATDGLASTGDGPPERDPTAAVGRSTIGNSGAPGVSRRVSAHSPTQGKPRSERPAMISESEGSEEVGDSKLKGKKQGEWDRTLSNPKTGNMVLPPKGSQAVYRDREEVGDGVRRQGRSGRSFSIPKPVLTTNEKADISSSTAKQLRSSRTEKAERGRTPTKKATSDRKSLTRIRRPTGNIVSDAGAILLSPAESDDDHEELANAVRATVDASAAACSNDFWKEVEPYFAFISSDNLSYLRQLADSKSSNDSSTPSTECTERTSHCSHANVETEVSPDRLEVRTGGRMGGSGGWYDKIYPLSQRLLAALINEGDDEDSKCDPLRDVYSTSNFPEKYADGFQGSFYSNGHGHLQSGAPYDEVSEPDDILAEKQTPENNHLFTGTKAEGFAASRPGTTWDGQYEHISFDDRILLELQSIGLAVEQVPDLSQRDEDELCLEICKLQDELKNQVSINRERVETLERTVLSRRETEARERERLALSKLVESAYTKRKGYRGSSAANKGAGTKGARAAALAFSKRTLARVSRFENGHSCIVDSTLRDILLCKQSPGVDGGDTPAASESIPLPKPGGKLVVRRTDANRIEAPLDPPRVSSKERDISPENAGPTLRNAGFGGAKGKRSERERDGKGQGKESHRKNDNDRVSRQGIATLKGERKTKTKPRQKAVFKDVNGLSGNPAAEAPKPAVALPLVQPPLLGPAEDLIPDEVVLGDNELGDWLAIDSMQDQEHDFLSVGAGLDVPMDDLTELGMMM